MNGAWAWAWVTHPPPPPRQPFSERKVWGKRCRPEGWRCFVTYLTTLGIFTPLPRSPPPPCPVPRGLAWADSSPGLPRLPAACPACILLDSPNRGFGGRQAGAGSVRFLRPIPAGSLQAGLRSPLMTHVAPAQRPSKQPVSLSPSNHLPALLLQAGQGWQRISLSPAQGCYSILNWSLMSAGIRRAIPLVNAQLSPCGWCWPWLLTRTLTDKLVYFIISITTYILLV